MYNLGTAPNVQNLPEIAACTPCIRATIGRWEAQPRPDWRASSRQRRVPLPRRLLEAFFRAGRGRVLAGRDTPTHSCCTIRIRNLLFADTS